MRQSLGRTASSFGSLHLAGCARAKGQVILLAAAMLVPGCNGSSSEGGYAAPKSLDAGSSSGADGPPPRTTGPIEPDDTASLSVVLQQGQLTGWIHAAVHDRGLYVFTYRKTGDFFSFAEFPLTPASDAVTAQLAKLRRHDAVTIKGSFIEKGAPIRHILLQDIKVVTPYVPDETATPRPTETAFPDELVGQTEAIGKVHAVDTDGRILVIEYADSVVPVFVSVPALTAGLYRNDKIRLAFQFSTVPPRPTHLWLDTANSKPIEVLERLLDLHGKPYQADGMLVRFPQSPEISTDVYALEVVDSDRVTREFTLLSNNTTIFNAIHDKLSAAWKAHPGTVIDGRNKLLNPSLRVHASGTFNLVAPNQANAQIILDSAADVTVTVSP